MSASHPSTRPVVLCADDFALHPGVSSGIAQLATQGRLSATSVMVLAPGWPRDAALLQALRGRIDVGLHLDWTSEFALQAGHGRPLGRLMLSAALGRLDEAAALALIEAQLDAFEAVWQAPPDHVDGHQHIQQFAGIREALVRALVRRYRRPGLRMPYLRISQPLATLADFKSRVIAAMGANALKKIAENSGVPRAGALLGIYEFEGSSAAYASRMARWLALAPPGGLIMCHPAATVGADDVIGPARLREFEVLGSAEFGLALHRAGVTLARGQEGVAR
jgi:chitin disaccharide deacetylase